MPLKLLTQLNLFNSVKKPHSPWRERICFLLSLLPESLSPVFSPGQLLLSFSLQSFFSLSCYNKSVLGTCPLCFSFLWLDHKLADHRLHVYLLQNLFSPPSSMLAENIHCMNKCDVNLFLTISIRFHSVWSVL